MNVDELISKYLDGDLTPEEDSFLRSVLSEDKSAKLNFDTDVHIHAAIKEDAKSIIIPELLISDTEDIILMKYLAEKEIQEEKPIYKINNITFYSLVATLLIFTIFNISDFTFKYHFINSDLSQNNNELQNKQNESQIQKPKRIKENIEAQKLNNQNLNTNALNLSLDNIIQEDSNLLNISLEDFANDAIISEDLNRNSIETNINNTTKAYIIDNIKEKSLTNEFNKNLSAKNSFNNPKDNQVNISSKFRNSNIIDLISNNSDVIVSSFLTNDFIGSGTVNNNISKIAGFSQSITYTIDEKHRLGVEMGTTEFTYKDKSNILIPIGKVDGGEVEVNNPPSGSGNGNYLIATIYNNKTQQYYWGAAFYENVIINTDKFSVLGRIGIGSTNSGPLTFARFYVNYNLFSGIFLTVGTEGKYFMHKQYQESSIITNWKGTAALTYGLQFKF